MCRFHWPLFLVAALGVGGPPIAGAGTVPASVYTGTLGQQAIVLELTPGDDAVSAGRYFDPHHPRDIALRGNAGGAGPLHLRAGWGDGDADDARITLARTQDGGWRGTWRAPGGKTQPIALAPATIAPPAANALPYLRRLYASDRYAYLRLGGLRPVAGKRERYMGHTLQWWRVPDADVASFEILDGYPPDERGRINRALMDRMWQDAGSFYDCLYNPSGAADYEEKVVPRLLTASLVSVSVLTDWYCGGAHPDSGDAPINLDAHTGVALTLEDLLWVGKGRPLHYAEDRDGKPTVGSDSFAAFSAYRVRDFAPWLLTQWQRLYPRQLRPAAGGDDCGYADPDPWQFPAWHMTPEGIFLGPLLARVDRACETDETWSVLPWSVVREHPGRLRPALPG